MNALKLKTILSLLIIAAGAISVPLLVTNSNASEPQASGFLIDFGNWNITWTEMDMEKNSDPYGALDAACNENDLTHTVENGTVREIGGVSSDDEYSWNLWTISKNSLTWVRESNPSGTDLSNYTIAAWAYCGEKETPTVAVDESGRSIYGYRQPQRTVSLSPALTEIIGSIRAVDTLVGTDKYSDYPNSVTAGQSSGKIKVIGDFLNPSYEMIAAQRPDIVFCDGSLYTHHLMADKLRNTGISAVLMYGGESIRTILSNIYIAGVTMGYGMRSAEAITALEHAAEAISGVLSENMVREISVMISLSADKSPWITGSDTYIDDISSVAMGKNVFTSQYQWVQINSEMVMSSNPSAIIVITTEYRAAQEEYDAMLRSLSAEWRSTNAYKNGNIYMICEAAGEMAQNPSPRFAQLMEITARMLHPDAFAEEMPKYIGNDYEDHLTITKDLNFKN